MSTGTFISITEKNSFFLHSQSNGLMDIGSVFLFNGISTFLEYSMLKPSLSKERKYKLVIRIFPHIRLNITNYVYIKFFKVKV